MTIPSVEYYTDKDTFSFDAGQLNYLSFYNKGEKVTVLERKDDPYKAKLHTFWYYYMTIPELITLLLVSGVIMGTYRFIITYKDSKS